MSFESKVQYIIRNVSNHDDAYYLIKALVDENTKEVIYTKDFLDTRAAMEVRDDIHGKREPK
jgi:hypothetical protein